MSSAPPKLLVVEDDDALRGCLARAFGPGLRAVLVSGTLSTEREHTASAPGVVGLLRKPVSAGELAEALLVHA